MRLATALRLAVLLFAVVVALASLEVGWRGAAGGFALAAFPTPLYVVTALWLDRFEPEPGPTLVKAFLWGAVVAAPFAMVLDGAAIYALSLNLGSAQADRLIGVASAPMLEELAKGLALVFLFAHRRDQFDNVTDGVVYAVLIGLGFAMSENVLFYGRAVEAGDITASFLLRGVAMPFAHPLFTCMTGLGLGYARERRTAFSTIVFPVLGLGTAMFLHGLWNYTTSRPPLFLAAYFLVMVPTFLGAYVLLERSLDREARLLNDFLSPFVTAGHFGEAALACACTRRGLVWWTREWFQRQRPAIARAHAFRQTAVTLAFRHLHGRTHPLDDGGPLDDDVADLITLGQRV